MNFWRRLPIGPGLLLGLIACSPSSDGVAGTVDGSEVAQSPVKRAGQPPVSVELEQVFPKLKVDRPVLLLTLPDGRGRSLVVEQPGRVRILNSSGDGSDAADWLDIRERVNVGHSEEGLLGMDFHPKFKENGLFYVYYSAAKPRRSIVSRFSVTPDGSERPNAAGETILMTVPQPYGNHNGGHILFGPDGFLYIGLGDGGAGGDPHNHGQNPRTLLGSMLRIDVDRPSGGRPYGIPADNPFADGAKGAPEVYAYGLRNPWRFSFDRKDGRLWAGDVGQNRWEEIHIVEKGKNYGWNIMEGLECYDARSCNRSGLTMPVATYSRSDGGSVTGGHVYRGAKLPTLQGWYVYGDFSSGNIWAIPAGGPFPATPRWLAQGRAISSFGEDPAGELYVLDLGGKIYRIVGKK